MTPSSRAGFTYEKEALEKNHRVCLVRSQCCVTFMPGAFIQFQTLSSPPEEALAPSGLSHPPPPMPGSHGASPPSVHGSACSGRPCDRNRGVCGLWRLASVTASPSSRSLTL